MKFTVREDFLPFARPDIGQAEIDKVSEVIRSGWLTTGPNTKEFERRFADYVGAKHAIALNSATAAMHLSLEAIGIQAGDEVIVPTFTFAATAEVVRYFDATPVLVDIDPKTLNIDPEKVAHAITKKTKAIIPVHVAGQAVDLDAIQALANKHDLNIIEDAAHALPTYYKNQIIGSISDFTTYSFYVTKTLATGEGGMITTNNDAWAERCRIMSLHGISKDAWKRYSDDGSWYYEIVAPGYKYNMTDISAALGLVQLEKLDIMNQKRLTIAERYNDALADNRCYEIPQADSKSTHSYHLYILRLNLDNLAIDRARFIRELHALNIGTSVHWMPLHMHPYYVDKYQYRPDDFPVAHREYWRVISLPIYSSMTTDDINYVINSLNYLAQKYGN